MAINIDNIGIISQVRMTSTRLPGKVLMTINDKTLLDYHLSRLVDTGLEIIIATTTNPADDPVCELSRKMGFKYFRGSEHNVLNRFYNAAKTFGIKHLVRVTSDCPLIDPDLIRNGVEEYFKSNKSETYLSNAIERTFARGFDFEVFSFESLEEANEFAKEPSDLEHVTPFIWKNKSGKINLVHFKQENNNSNLRVTVDTLQDFELIKQLITKFHAEKLSAFGIEQLLLGHPELIAINAEVHQKKVN